MKGKNKAVNYIEELTVDDDCDNNGICDNISGTVSGTVISSFNFVKENPPSEVLLKAGAVTSLCLNNDGIIDNRKFKTMATETTPPIEDEPLNVPRSYKIRNSTARMLNEIKAAHPDVNVYMNTIVDTALRNYYDFFFSEFTPPTR